MTKTITSTLFHITQPKAGSQWIYKILHDATTNLIYQNESYVNFLAHNIIPGKIYPTLYITKSEFDNAPVPPDSEFFVIVRDPRDLLISLYFSIKYSHPITSDKVVNYRNHLNDISIEDGLIFLINDYLHMPIGIHKSWAEADIACIKYEDLLLYDVEILSPILSPYTLHLSKQDLKEIIIKNRFENITNGRKRGDEDIHAHERKALPGDWKNFFTDNVKRQFKENFGTHLVRTKYAENNNW